MNISKRVVISSLVFVFVLSAGLLFWPFILNNIIKPTALTVWFLIRMLVLSVDQIYFWWAIILVALILLFRFLPEELIAIQSDDHRASNATIENIEYWRDRFTYDNQNTWNKKISDRILYIC